MNVSLKYDDGLSEYKMKGNAPCKSAYGRNLNDYEFSDWFQYGKCILTEGLGVYKGKRVVKGKANQVIKVDSSKDNGSIMGVGVRKLEKISFDDCKKVSVDCSGSEPVNDYVPFNIGISRVSEGRIVPLKEAREMYYCWNSLV